jgi:hypothetical protein
MENLSNLRTTRQLCEACGVTRAAVAIWREMGMPSISLHSQQCVYDAAEVMAWLERKLPRRAEQLRAWEAAR